MTSVLIVEDELIVALMVEDSLQAAGYQVCGIAASEAEALALAEAHRPDMAVVDIRLNPGDGLEVARELRTRYGAQILFASGHATELPLGQDGQADLVLAKPYLPDDVPRALDALQALARGEPAPEPLPISLLSARS